MLKVPKRSFVVVVVLVLGVESKAKNVSDGTKIVQGNEKFARVQTDWVQKMFMS